jgi:hypothetical protein
MACPNDAKALMAWGRRLLTFPDAGGLGQSSLHDMLELGLLNRVGSVTPAGPVAPAKPAASAGPVAPAGPLVPWSRPPLQLAAVLH